MPNREFLENYPLYRKFSTKLPSVLHKLPIVAINMECTECGSSQTFNMKGAYHEGSLSPVPATGGAVLQVVYFCKFCGKGFRVFVLRFDLNLQWVQKIGQHPPWSIEPSADVKHALGDKLPNYKKGLISESQGYGIGAFAYYRRIVETTIDVLLDDIHTLIEGEEHLPHLQLHTGRSR